MKSYSVIVTPQALRHMEDIKRYISVSLQAPTTARNLILLLRKEMRSLSTMPDRTPLTPEEPWHSKGIHKMPVKNYIVYYWVDEEHLMVRIIAVIYARRDQKRALQALNRTGD